VIFHPVTSEVDTIGAQARSLFGALEASGKNFVVIAPNNDPGTEDIFAVLEKLPSERFRLIPSMRFNYFSELMKNAAVMVGNSSAGVREAPFLGLPSLDVGTRQSARAQGPSITGCSAFDVAVITEFLTLRWGHSHATDPLFGDGQASKSFARLIQVPAFWSSALQKGFGEGA
jgi:UDP-N-acetylglucosamine 2-epimerase (hydrolysing)